MAHMQGSKASDGVMVELARAIRERAAELGFSQITISDVDFGAAERALLDWIAQGRHGSMDYMARHGALRARPAELQPGAQRVLSVYLDYLPAGSGPDWRDQEWARLADPQAAAVSLYARGRDYHKVMRARLQRLAEAIAELAPGAVARVCCDSAPVLEVEAASRSGLGWRGKHTLLLRRDRGSLFFLGEILLGLPLPVDPPQAEHCGSCRRCIDVCPTGAITAPYQLDARLCISYLTIEHDGPIPVALRPLLGNRIYGCDDCQLVCPWNRWARPSPLPDFLPRQGLEQSTLLQLWDWDEAQFLARTEGSPIRRIGYARWRRNLAVALGNARRALAADDPAQPQLAQALQSALALASPLLAEHLQWALAQVAGAAVESQPSSARKVGSDSAPSSVDRLTRPAT